MKFQVIYLIFLEKNMLKIIELFAGIGTQTQALKEVNIPHEVVATSEIDKYASEAYELLHGKVNNHGDITKIKKLPEADLWTYSFPCTDISVAGKRKGLEKGSQTSSSLLWEVQRLLEISKRDSELPFFLLMENVKNLVSKKFYPYFQEWCSYLESLGYKNFWKIINAKDCGIPQNRERVFMISIRDSQAQYEFPQKEELRLKLSDFLESDVDDKYYLSEKMISNFCDMKNRKNFIRGLRFKPHELDDRYGWAITANAGSRATDNYVVVPVACALRGRKNENGEYKQNLEIYNNKIMSSLTTVRKDNLVLLVPENTKAGYAVAHEGDGIYINRCSFKRGVVQKSMIPTLKSSCSDIGVITSKNDWVCIRKLTPRECWRLMGWKDADIDKVIDHFSNTQLYKMAGNAFVFYFGYSNNNSFNCFHSCVFKLVFTI